MSTFLKPRGLTPGETVSIEHYPPGTRAEGRAETFDLVTFPVGCDGEPQWSKLDRGSVERFVGREL